MYKLQINRKPDIFSQVYAYSAEPHNADVGREIAALCPMQIYWDSSDLDEFNREFLAWTSKYSLIVNWVNFINLLYSLIYAKYCIVEKTGQSW